MAIRKIKGKKLDAEMPIRSDSSPEYFPSFYIGLEHLPEAKDWEIGKTYEVTLHLKQTGLNMRKGPTGESSGDASFDIVGIDVEGEVKGKQTMSRYQEKDDDLS